LSPVPDQPKIYHIVHCDRLPSIIAERCLWSDAETVRGAPSGTMIGMPQIKRRRLTKNTLESHPGLYVGQCVPFYFCPRSVMLYLLHRSNHPELEYRGGQEPIVHLEADLYEAVEWAEAKGRRWAFTLTNAGSSFFEDRADLDALQEIDWSAVQAADWRACKEAKQAEFLLERSFPWHLVQRIGVCTRGTLRSVGNALGGVAHAPPIEIRPDWYY
jgi:ssDNA thymidine ADP-ribosyltransferase, DarT